MRYRIDPISGTKLSALGFGCMRYVRGASTDKQAVERLIMQAIESGVNYFDTAYIYGTSEAILGEILHKNNVRDKVHIATKLPHFMCKTSADFDKFFDAQKERLKTDYFDYYLIHSLSDARSWQRVVAMGIEDWIAAKKSSGEIRRIGFSFHGAQSGFMELLDMYGWEFCMIQYNYMNENYQAGRAGLQKAHSKGLPVIVMEPLLGGKLAVDLPKKAEKLFKDADPSRSPAEWSLLWLWNQPEVTVVLSGMNSEQQLTDNAASAAKSSPGMATEADLAVIESVRKVFRETFKVQCTGCDYCMPCPKNVNIPGCFSAYNTSFGSGFSTGLTEYLRSTNAVLSKDNLLASNCVKCGLCEKKCPQHIKIVEELEAVKRRMEPFWISIAIKILRLWIRAR
ncbi:MAG: aldo/keto reductase [Defluviitaleaceae bacterium]|nr:aldo/keto reductase [Defluviitaleaceae bacterium]